MTSDGASHFLRTATAADHEAVDAVFGRFDLSDATGYRALLTAHAAALIAAETALPAMPGFAWRPRTPLIVADLDILGAAPPPPLALVPPASPAAAWGLLYVLEGSRLGNAYLVRGVPDGLPTGYMGARHLPGEWRTFLAALDREGETGDAQWRDAALDGARSGFALYQRAAG